MRLVLLKHASKKSDCDCAKAYTANTVNIMTHDHVQVHAIANNWILFKRVWSYLYLNTEKITPETERYLINELDILEILVQSGFFLLVMWPRFWFQHRLSQFWFSDSDRADSYFWFKHFGIFDIRVRHTIFTQRLTLKVCFTFIFIFDMA